MITDQVEQPVEEKFSITCSRKAMLQIIWSYAFAHAMWCKDTGQFAQMQRWVEVATMTLEKGGEAEATCALMLTWASMRNLEPEQLASVIADAQSKMVGEHD